MTGKKTFENFYVGLFPSLTALKPKINHFNYIPITILNFFTSMPVWVCFLNPRSTQLLLSSLLHSAAECQSSADWPHKKLRYTTISSLWCWSSNCFIHLSTPAFMKFIFITVSQWSFKNTNLSRLSNPCLKPYNGF